MRLSASRFARYIVVAAMVAVAAASIAAACLDSSAKITVTVCRSIRNSETESECKS